MLEILVFVEPLKVSGIFEKLHLLTVEAGALAIPLVLFVKFPPIVMLSVFPAAPPQSSIPAPKATVTFPFTTTVCVKAPLP